MNTITTLFFMAAIALTTAYNPIVAAENEHSLTIKLFSQSMLIANLDKFPVPFPLPKDDLEWMVLAIKPAKRSGYATIPGAYIDAQNGQLVTPQGGGNAAVIDIFGKCEAIYSPSTPSPAPWDYKWSITEGERRDDQNKQSQAVFSSGNKVAIGLINRNKLGTIAQSTEIYALPDDVTDDLKTCCKMPICPLAAGTPIITDNVHKNIFLALLSIRHASSLNKFDFSDLSPIIIDSRVPLIEFAVFKALTHLPRNDTIINDIAAAYSKNLHVSTRFGIVSGCYLATLKSENSNNREIQDFIVKTKASEGKVDTASFSEQEKNQHQCLLFIASLFDKK